MKRLKKFTEELYKKYLNDLDNHNDVFSHSEPDILECEVTWVLRSTAANKASGGDRMPAKLFKVLKDDGIKSASLNMSENLENPAVTRGLEIVNPPPSS